MLTRRVATLSAAVSLLCCCGPPVVDTSSPFKLVTSVEKIRRSLEEDQAGVKQFDDALAYLTDGAELSGDPASLEPLLAVFAPLDGMTAEQIVLEAWSRKIALLEQQVGELEARRDASAPARQQLARLTLLEARLFKKAPDYLQWPVVEVVVENATKQRIYLVGFQASLRAPDSIEPWLVERFDQTIRRGLKPGERKSWRIEPEADTWDEVSEARPDDVFVLEVMRLEGRNGKLIAASDYGAIDELQLRTLGTRLEELRANRPFAAPDGAD